MSDGLQFRRTWGTACDALDRIDPPAEPEVEQAVLGAFMSPVLRPLVITQLSTLMEELFSVPRHQAVLRAIQVIVARAELPDVMTVAAVLPAVAEDVPDDLVPWLADMAFGSTELIEPRTAVRRLRDLARWREARVAVRRAARGVGELATIDVVRSTFLRDMEQADRFRVGEESARMAMERRTVAEATDPTFRGTRLGFAGLDRFIVGGASPGNLILLAGRPGMGKTSLALQLLEEVAAAGWGASLLSLEMSDTALMRRAIARATRISLERQITKRLTADERATLADSARYLLREGPYARIEIEAPVVGETVVRLTSEDVGPMIARHRDRLLARGIRLGLAVIDYFGLLRDEAGPGEGPVKLIERQTMNLLEVSRALGVPLLVLTQLNRENTRRKERRPQLQDLRGSGSLEQDADTVLFVHRDGYYDPTPGASDAGVAEIIVAKAREGKTGTVNAWWNGEFAEFARSELDIGRDLPA